MLESLLCRILEIEQISITTRFPVVSLSAPLPPRVREILKPGTCLIPRIYVFSCCTPGTRAMPQNKTDLLETLLPY